MQPERLAVVTRRLARRYPQVLRVRPRVRRIRLPDGRVRVVTAADGRRLLRSVRALITPGGRLRKVATPR